MSNNVAEYSGVAAILERLQREEEVCLIRGDSNLVIMQLQRKWKVKGGLYTPFWQKAKALYEPIRDRVTFEWVPRDENEICDVLSKGVLHDRGIKFGIQPSTLLDFKRQSVQFAQAAKSNAVAPVQTSGAPNAVQKSAKTRILEEGQPCPHCSTPVVKRAHTKPPKHKVGGYYFSYWFQCPKCKALYMVESAKKFFDNEIDERFQQALELDGS
jgi:ribonuclease HI